MSTKLPISPERIAEIANQSFVTEANQTAFGVNKKADVAQTNYKSGITTSDDAAAKVKSINEQIAKIQGGINKINASSGQNTPASTTSKDSTKTTTDTSSPFAALFERINTLQTNLNAAKEAEKAARDAAAGVDAKSNLKKVGSAEEAGAGANADLSAATNAVAAAERGEIFDTTSIADVEIRNRTNSLISNIGIISQQMTTLEQYRNRHNQYVQEEIDSIAQTAERSIKRQEAENERAKRAIEAVGAITEMSRYLPLVQQSIIHEVIQEGLDEIEIINDKKNAAIREARKAEDDFNLELFEQNANLAKDYNDRQEEAFSKMNARVRQVEQDERERITFRQKQEERSAILLAEELIDATPEKVMQTAVANGIDPGLLTKAVSDAKFEQSERAFKEKDQALTLEEKRASINKTYNDIRLDNEGADKKEEVKIPDDIYRGFRAAGLSKSGAEEAWGDVDILGLDGAVTAWVEAGYPTDQVKSMISSYEKSQREKDVTGALIETETEKRLKSYVDKLAATTKLQKQSEQRYKGLPPSISESLFKQQ